VAVRPEIDRLAGGLEVGSDPDSKVRYRRHGCRGNASFAADLIVDLLDTDTDTGHGPDMRATKAVTMSPCG
jgi:hypothetical protein